MKLQKAIGIQLGELVAFVGAGGKTTAAWQLMNSLLDAGERVIFSTTTRIFEPRDAPLVLAPYPRPGPLVIKLLESPGLILAATEGEPGDPEHAARCPYPAKPVKLVGLKAMTVNELARRLPGVTWLVEADGAKGRLLKAPTEHEPAIPRGADRVVVVAGLGAIGKALDEQTVHRPEIAAEFLNVALGTAITPDMFARLIGHTSGGLKSVPPRAEAVALLTQQGDTPSPHAESVARQLLSSSRISRVALAGFPTLDPALEVWQRP